MSDRCLPAADAATVLDESRTSLVMVSTYEIAALANHIITLTDATAEHLVLRGLAARIFTLNSVIMAAVGDADDATEAIARKVYCDTPLRQCAH